MPESSKLILIIALSVVLFSFIKMIRSGHFVKAFAVSSLSGVGSLFAVNLISFATNITLSINWFTLIFCSFTGISGSITLLLLNILKNIK